VILFSDILTPLTGMNIPFDITAGKGPVIADPIRTMEVSQGCVWVPSVLVCLPPPPRPQTSDDVSTYCSTNSQQNLVQQLVSPGH
jgi:hypothetical protein